MGKQLVDESTQWYAGIPRSARRPTLFGFGVILATILGFGYWSTTALIAGAIVASGSFVATGANKIVQHFEGGVIETIHVKEGDHVEEGQVLISLDETAPKAELRRLVLREAQAMALEARLRAEVEERDEIVFPPELLARRDDPDVAEILARERQSLTVRRTFIKSQVATLREGIDALNQRIEGGKVQLAHVKQQLDFFSEELEGKQMLLKGGLIRKPEVLALQRAHANLQGEVGRLNGEIGDARERIARIHEQITGVRNANIKTVIEQNNGVSAELKDVRERIRSAEAVLQRVQITAPVRGVVLRLKYHTPGGVIEAGKSVMEILPLQDELVIEARIRPRDIDSVKQGQHAMVRLTALNRRITPMVDGEVVYVSADSVDDEGQQSEDSDVYMAKVKLDPEEAAKVPGFSPTPGMPAEVYIKTADRTFLEYITKPLVDSMARAFRET